VVVGVVAGEEVVPAEVVAAGVGVQDVPDDDEQRVRDRGLGAFAATPCRDAVERRVRVGVLLPDRAERGGSESGFEPSVAGTDVAGFASAGGLVVARADPSPMRLGARCW
jgi:hypothetical protein